MTEHKLNEEQFLWMRNWVEDLSLPPPSVGTIEGVRDALKEFLFHQDLTSKEALDGYVLDDSRFSTGTKNVVNKAIKGLSAGEFILLSFSSCPGHLVLT